MERLHTPWDGSPRQWFQKGVFLMCGQTHTQQKIVRRENVSIAYFLQRRFRAVHLNDPWEQIFLVIIREINFRIFHSRAWCLSGTKLNTVAISIGSSTISSSWDTCLPEGWTEHCKIIAWKLHVYYPDVHLSPNVAGIALSLLNWRGYR